MSDKRRDLFYNVKYVYYSDRVQALVYSAASKQLLSTADDKIVAIWDMVTKRIEVSLEYHVTSTGF